MALFNIFKKKPSFAPASAKASAGKKATAAIIPPKPKKISDIAYRVLKGPQVTEKATDLAQKNQYVFKVSSWANKTDIKKAIEEVWGVNVTAVKTIKIPAKKRRLGRIEGWRAGHKKAIVKIKEGQKIEVLPR